MANISIHIDAPNADEARDQMMRLIGAIMVPPSALTPEVSAAALNAVNKMAAPQPDAGASNVLKQRSAETPETVTETKPLEGEVLTADDSRPRGKPSAGGKRRTKAETADDETLEKLAAEAQVPLDKLDAALAQVGRAKTIEGLKERIAATPQPSISTGGERLGPEDDPETDVQDADDEAAENTGKELTIDDVKNSMGAYLAKHGMAATQEDGAAIFGDALGAPPVSIGEIEAPKGLDGKLYWKTSLVAAAGQDNMRKAVAAWTKAAEAPARYKKAA